MRPLCFALLLAAAVVVLSDTPSAQHHDLGTVHFPTSCQPAVQAEFERGVAMIHSYWFNYAGKTFRGVLDKDPACAMAYWGIAMDLLGNTLAACSLLSESMSRLRGSYFRDYLVEMIENYPTGMGNAPAAQAFPRFTLGPGQRYSSKGAYIVKFKDADGAELELVHDWLVPP